MAANIWLDPVNPGDSRKIELHDGQEARIGRHPQNNVVLSLDTIGKRHCSISHRDGVTVIETLGTYCRVSVNGIRIDKASLAPGDLVEIGGVEFIVRGPHSELADA